MYPGNGYHTGSSHHFRLPFVATDEPALPNHSRVTNQRGVFRGVCALSEWDAILMVVGLGVDKLKYSINFHKFFVSNVLIKHTT
jgi:hypothetical protein